MSTFGGLNTAYTGITAASKGLGVTAQNIANAGTTGYTRQRVETSSLPPLPGVGLAAAPIGAGQGVKVDSVSRLGDIMLDARVRNTAADAGYTAVRAEAFVGIEATLREPGDQGLSARMQSYWSAWQDVANSPGVEATTAVLLQEGAALANQVSRGFSELESQWASARTELDSLTADLNSAGSAVAKLNEDIRSTLASGGSANEMIDQRDQLTARIAALAGGTVRHTPDGMTEVFIGGNALVSGTEFNAVKAAGSYNLSGSADAPRIEWTNRPVSAINLNSGEIAGVVSVLAPAAAGKGGPIAEAAAFYDEFATSLAESVNTVHRAGTTADGSTGLDFFGFTPGAPAAAGLRVVASGIDTVAAGSPGAGGKDGSNADAISQVGVGNASPNTKWGHFVTLIGVESRTALQAGTQAEVLANSAHERQLSGASVSLDEESMSLVAYQHAYNANARVMSTLNDILDTIVNLGR